MFRINTFGAVTLSGPDGVVTGRAVQRHRLALLARLAVAGDRGAARDGLAALLWPDSEPDRARRQLSDSIYRINQAVGEEAIASQGEALTIQRRLLDSDVTAFLSAIDAEDWTTAVELHSAPFLDGFASISDGFDRWLDGERRQLLSQFRRALEHLARDADETRPDDAPELWRRLAAADPFSSRTALGLMQSLARVGERAAAVQHARKHTAFVREELGLEPDPEVLVLAEEYRRPPPGGTPTLTAEVDRITERGLSVEEPSSGPGATHTMEVSTPPAPTRGRRTTTLGLVAALATVLVAAFAFANRGPTSSEEELRSIAVLPFADLSPDGDQEYFADGITDELISQLSRFVDLRVVGRTSAFAFKGTTMDAREIGQELDVQAILEGSVRQAGGQLRIAVQLIDAENGFERWSQLYESDLTDVFALQAEIASGVVTRMTGAEPAAAIASDAAPTDPEALSLYLDGRFEWHRRTEASLERAVTLLEGAVAVAPDFARAHAGLADAYAVQGFYDQRPPDEAFPLAEAAANRAVALAPDLAEPVASLGYVALYHDWEPDLAEQHFVRSIELNPAYSTAHQWYANLLLTSGRFDDAERAMRQAQALDPLSRIASAALGFVFYHAGDLEAALTELERTLALDEEFELAHLWSGFVHERTGQLTEAVDAYRRAVESSGSAIARAALARGLILGGDVTRGRDLLAALEAEAADGYAPAYEIAKVHEALGDRDATMEWLERGFDERSHSMVFLSIDPQLEALRADPAFRALVSRVPVAAEARGRIEGAD